MPATAEENNRKENSEPPHIADSWVLATRENRWISFALRLIVRIKRVGMCNTHNFLQTQIRYQTTSHPPVKKNDSFLTVIKLHAREIFRVFRETVKSSHTFLSSLPPHMLPLFAWSWSRWNLPDSIHREDFSLFIFLFCSGFSAFSEKCLFCSPLSHTHPRWFIYLRRQVRRQAGKTQWNEKLCEIDTRRYRKVSLALCSLPSEFERAKNYRDCAVIWSETSSALSGFVDCLWIANEQRAGRKKWTGPIIWRWISSYLPLSKLPASEKLTRAKAEDEDESCSRQKEWEREMTWKENNVKISVKQT